MADGSTLTPPQLHSTFAVTLALNVEQPFQADVHGGVRVDLKYSETEGVISHASPGCLKPELASILTTAVLLSGNDWVMVSDQGVVAFDSRITLALPLPALAEAHAQAESSDRALITARLRGKSALREMVDKDGKPWFEDRLSDEGVFRKWKSSLVIKETSYLPLVLAVSFEVPSAGFDMEQTKLYEACSPLAKSLFVGNGWARIAEDAGWPHKVDRIELNLFEVKADKPLPEFFL